jgi:hypothetical protein
MDKKQNKIFRPTDAIRNNSLRGTVLLNKSKALAAKSTIEKVKVFQEKITKGELELNDIKALYTFLVKSQEKYQPLKRIADGGLDSDSAAFLAAGGTSALAWTRLVLKQENILKSYTKDISDALLHQEEVIKGIVLPISKAVNEELMQVTYVVMIPEEADLHGDETSENEVRKACHNFNQHCMKANLFHLVETSSFSIVESYICPVDFILSEHLVKAGTWLCTLQIHDESVWTLIKSGDICAVSIGALASVEVVDE